MSPGSGTVPGSLIQTQVSVVLGSIKPIQESSVIKSVDTNETSLLDL